MQSSTGYEVICCMESDVLQRSVEVKYLLDPCNYTMSITLENIDFSAQLLGYEWGKISELWIRNFLLKILFVLLIFVCC